MKKFFKFVITIAAICAGVAGGLFLYNKFKGKCCCCDNDYDNDFDDDFGDDDDDNEDSYVNINKPADATEE